MNKEITVIYSRTCLSQIQTFKCIIIILEQVFHVAKAGKFYITFFSEKFIYCDERVVRDGKVITSQGPGTCFEFALAIVEALQGKEKRDSIVPPMLLNL
jgi:hypothetical protein